MMPMMKWLLLCLFMLYRTSFQDSPEIISHPSSHNIRNILSVSMQGAVLAQWWEHWPSTNVARVRFPDRTSYVGWVCWFSTLLREVFPRVLRFSPLTKNRHLIWFDLCWFDFLSPQLVEPLFSAKYIWDINKVIIINIIVQCKYKCIQSCCMASRLEPFFHWSCN